SAINHPEAGVMSAASAGDGAVSTQPGAPGAASGGGRRRWLILAVIATAQLMVVLDMTVVNIALPSAQKALHFTNADRQWIITGYALAFGSPLLPGGKLADLLGRKQTFLAGLIGFAAASAVGGAATGFGMLVVARVCQGGFGGLLAPAGLSLLTTTFPGRRSAAPRSAPTEGSSARAALSGCCSAACSPSTCPGAGASTSTWSSQPPGSP